MIENVLKRATLSIEPALQGDACQIRSQLVLGQTPFINTN
jgi:hypothetical protein